LVRLAVAAAEAISAGHAFVIMLANGYPINVMNQVKAVPEVCTIFCASANPVEMLVAITDRGRGIIGVVDGSPPVGVETDADAASRHRLLRDIGYKL
jgi:adenosine/AMP kinase